jgi:prephenate dehydrogenase
MIRPDAIVTDVASTKKVIVERADAAGLWFVGGHPMAAARKSATRRLMPTCSSIARGSWSRVPLRPKATSNA